MNRYPVRVEARHEESLSRWLWLVKWLLLVPHHLALLVLWTGLVVLTLVAWLFAIPHLLIIGALNGAATWSPAAGDARTTAPIGVVSAALLIAGLALLFTGHHPRGLARLLIGIARWNLRVLAYLTLLTPRYPPFRLDQGGMEPDGPDGGPPPRAAHAETRSGPVQPSRW